MDEETGYVKIVVLVSVQFIAFLFFMSRGVCLDRSNIVNGCDTQMKLAYSIAPFMSIVPTGTAYDYIAVPVSLMYWFAIALLCQALYPKLYRRVDTFMRYRPRIS